MKLKSDNVPLGTVQVRTGKKCVQKKKLIIFFFAVDCEWLDWEDWGPCSVSCGGGRQLRKRFFIPAQFEGKACSGARFEVRKCNIEFCPSKKKN